MWNGLKSAFQNNTGYLRTAVEVLFPIPMRIINHWQQLGSFFASLWGGIKTAFTSAWNTISPIIDRISEAIDAISNSWVGQKIGAGIQFGENLARRGMDAYANYADRMVGYTLRTPPALDDDVRAAGIEAARKNGLDPAHYLALLQVENGGHRNVSPVGAFGPSQLMPETARGLGVATSVDDPNYDWHQNLNAGARYYKQLLGRFHGDYGVADAAYNAGPNSAAVGQFAQTHNIATLPKETRDYVGNIEAQSLHVVIDTRGAPGATARVAQASPGIDVTHRTSVQRAMDPALSSTGN